MFLNFNSTMGKKEKKEKEPREENLIFFNYHTLFLSPNVLHIFTPTVCYLHSPHDMSENETFHNFCF